MPDKTIADLQDEIDGLVIQYAEAVADLEYRLSLHWYTLMIKRVIDWWYRA